MNPYSECPTFNTNSFIIRLIKEEDSPYLFNCYNDNNAVAFMNEDNCDFGFYVETQDKMQETVGYWLDFYKKGYFIRFTIVDIKTNKAVGTIEGFNGETGVLRVDICSEYEKEQYLSEIFLFATENFYEYFGNKNLVTKAIPTATQRRMALNNNGWEFIDVFRNYGDYYKIKTKE